MFETSIDAATARPVPERFVAEVLRGPHDEGTQTGPARPAVGAPRFHDGDAPFCDVAATSPWQRDLVTSV